MSGIDMMRGLRHFLHMGGAEETDTARLMEIRSKCNDVLKQRHVPTGKIVHYKVEGPGDRKGVSCGSVWQPSHISDDNSTVDVKHVSCVSCKKTQAFRKANGEDVEESVTVAHWAVNGREQRHHWGSVSDTVYDTACMKWCTIYDLGRGATFSAADVTCKNCMRTKSYQ